VNGVRRRSLVRTAIVAVLLLAFVFSLYQFLSSDSPQRTVRSWAARAWGYYFEAFPVEDEELLADLHASPERSARTRCVACHGDKTDSVLPVHRIHVTSDLLADLACPDCHTDIELGVRGARNAPVWVDVGFCAECHSTFPGSSPGVHDCSDDLGGDCGECHTGDMEPVHDEPYLPSSIPLSECAGCHGGRALPWTAEHTQEDWLDVHGQEALEQGEEECFACHDFGLKFCDDCHSEKPPSHIPSDEWRVVHPERAQADTRVCYSCHETTWCKECHVNHEEGWMESHPDFVEEYGDESCTECHSLTSCTFCHTETAAQGDVSLSTKP
jgi:hypothetical protein